MAAPAQAMPPPAAQPSCFSRTFGACSRCLKGTEINKLMQIFRVVNILNGGFLILAGVWGYINASEGVNVVYLSTYVGLFGILMIGFELRWNTMENQMRRQFGFMYSPYGRACFFAFSATLCWGIDLWLPILIGIVTLVNALLQCFIFCAHPDFKQYSELKKTDNPANLPDSEVIAYLQQHPEVAQQAVSTGGAFAAPAPAPTPSAPRRSAPRKPAPAPRSSAPPAAPARSSSSAPPQSDNPFDL